WQIIALGVVAFMLVKGLAIYIIARILGSSRPAAAERAVLMGQGGEFAFVLYTTAVSAGIIDGPTNAIFTATVIISMVLTPLAIIVMRYLTPTAKVSMDGIEVAENLTGSVLIIGFGRFGQIVSQPLLAMRHSVSIIDNDPEMIRPASQIGFKVYYGDGTRLDVLRAAGAATADVILVCTDKKEETTKIAELIGHEFPLAKVMARAFDRGHAIELVKVGVEYQVRELLESALTFGGEVIKVLGASDQEAAEVVEGVRSRDTERFELQMLGGGMLAGRHLLINNAAEQARESGRQVSEDAVREAIESNGVAEKPA
ncbi:MAG: potassium transporter, partial [Rhizobiaceae bacterium]